ncbi:MAG: NTP transferase domain-containing protein [Spirochaetaceae bacterium]|nr:NTP transferase domain-containing protein [Spirochaetaceae bacterium]
MLLFKEFEILRVSESEKERLSQRGFSKKTGLSVGTINATIMQLEEKGLLADGMITQAGLEALEPYRVKRAIFIAAGFGSRMVPITLNTPKPLVRVKGERIIDSILDAVVAAGIEDIVIVRGYLSEQFDQLLYKYPNIKFVENPAYNEANNISSAMCIRYLLGNSYVCEGDILLHNPKIIQKYQYQSNYCGIKVDRTDDWCLFENKGRITGVAVGGENCHQMMGISYWTEDDGKRLGDCIKKVYEMPGGKERYWDQVALQYFVDDFNIAIRECSAEDFIEIDTFNELKAIDSVYDV